MAAPTRRQARDRRRRAKRLAATAAVVLVVALYEGPVSSLLHARDDTSQLRADVSTLQQRHGALQQQAADASQRRRHRRAGPRRRLHLPGRDAVPRERTRPAGARAADQRRAILRRAVARVEVRAQRADVQVAREQDEQHRAQAARARGGRSALRRGAGRAHRARFGGVGRRGRSCLRHNAAVLAASDVAAVERQLGRPPRALARIALRCPHGRPGRARAGAVRGGRNPVPDDVVALLPGAGRRRRPARERRRDRASSSASSPPTRSCASTATRAEARVAALRGGARRPAAVRSTAARRSRPASAATAPGGGLKCLHAQPRSRSPPGPYALGAARPRTRRRATTRTAAALELSARAGLCTARTGRTAVAASSGPAARPDRVDDPRPGHGRHAARAAAAGSARPTRSRSSSTVYAALLGLDPRRGHARGPERELRPRAGRGRRPRLRRGGTRRERLDAVRIGR